MRIPLFLLSFFLFGTIFASNTVAPSFTLSDEYGNARSLDEFREKKVALCFYPKSGTHHSVRYFCDLRDHFAELKKQGIVVLGICYDSPTSNLAFKERCHLPFPLLSDAIHKTTYNYGVYDFIFGHTEPKRKTVLIDEQGNMVTTIKKVHKRDHYIQIIENFKKYDATKNSLCYYNGVK